MTTSCPSQAELQSFLDDSLPPEQESGVVAHVESCDHCQQAMDNLTTQGPLSAAPPKPAQTIFRPAFRDRLARLAPVKEKPSTWLGLSGLYDTSPPGVNNTAQLQAKESDKVSRLGSYEILTELGRGGMGIVYLARDVRLGRRVALKMIRGGEFTDTEQQARFLAEAKAIAQLKHPNIVQLFEMGTLDGRLYFALEYVAGGSLAQRLQGRPMPAIDTAALIEPLARAVHHAHQQNIVHRDLKPANILLAQKSEIRNSKSETNPKDPKSKSETKDREGSDFLPSDLGFVSDFEFRISDFDPKVTDFGLAKRLDDVDHLTKTGIIVGTPSYMAPEQARGEKDVGPATDTYALGTILYECLTGRPPFLGATSLETLDAVQNDEPQPPTRLQRKVPRDIETICLKCLHKEPRRRYLTAEALADDLQRFLRGEPILARPVSPPERLYRWCRRNPLAAAFLATLTVAAVALASLAWWALDQRDQAQFQAHRADASAHEAETHAREAEDKRQEAEKERQEADKQRKEALANLEQAKKAVDNCFRLAQWNPLFQGQQQRARRVLLLQQAKPFYERFVQQRSDDPNVLEGQAEILWSLSDIYLEVGPLKNAVDALQNANSIYQRLSVQQPEVGEWQVRIGSTWITCGSVQHSLGLMQEALACFTQAEKLQRRLLDGPSSNLTPAHIRKLNVDLSLACHNQGVVHRDLGHPSEAFTHFNQARQMQQQLIERYPNVLEYRAHLARTLQNLTTVCMDLKRYNESRDFNVQARRLWEQLAAQEPDRLDYQTEIAHTWQSLGILYGLTKEPRVAIHAYDQARQLFEKVLARQPRVLQNAALLGSTYCSLGNLWREQGNYRQASVMFARGRTVLQNVLAQEPSESSARTYLGNAHLGQAELLEQLHRYTASLPERRRAIALSPEAYRTARQMEYAICRKFSFAEQACFLGVLVSEMGTGASVGELLGQLTSGLLRMMPVAQP